VIYVANLKGKQTVVVDGFEGDWYDAVYPKGWHDGVDGSGIGFFQSNAFFYFAREANKVFFVTEFIDQR